MSKRIPFLLLIISLFLFNYEICQDYDQDTMKAIACISLIKKMGNKITDKNLISGYMLSCFINIDDSAIQNLIANQLSNDINMEQKEMDKLVDFATIQSKYSQNEIIDYSKKLNSALEKLKNVNEMHMPSGQRRREKGSNKNTENEGSLLSFIISNIFKLFNPNDSFLVLIGFFVVSYFCLKGLRKLCDEQKHNNNKKKGKRQ